MVVDILCGSKHLTPYPHLRRSVSEFEIDVTTKPELQAYTQP